MDCILKIVGLTSGLLGLGYVAIKIFFPWLKEDIKLLRIGMEVKKHRKIKDDICIIDQWDNFVLIQPDETFLIYEDKKYSYVDIDEMANKVASLGKSWGLKLGDNVAIMIHNEPAFIWTFLGFQKIGVAVAFINHNLVKDPLLHSIKAIDIKALIIGSGDELVRAVREIKTSIRDVPIYLQGIEKNRTPFGFLSFDDALRQTEEPLSFKEFRDDRKGLASNMSCCYIYTSGTTGTPKPVSISQFKASGSSSLLNMVFATSEDVLYIPLPLYHSAGCLVGLFGTIGKGGCIVLKKKFSASSFWSDCCRYNVTLVQYIGELFRYLLLQPHCPEERSHKVRAAIGNGLRKDIFEEVLQRYKLNIVEIFGSTEGNTIILNVSNKPGAIGRVSPLLNAIDPDPKYLVQFDLNTATPIRNEQGRCIKAKIGEPGLFISRVPAAHLKSGKYSVYSGLKEASEKKLVRNAFVEGDIYFNFGDVCVMDKEYYIYFHDRLGDTFRWKGENVSTTEVANEITSLPYINDANVYGVTIPNHDGRAGMAAISLQDNRKLGQTELKELYNTVTERLPKYARPLFIRQLEDDRLTSTMKQKKGDLIKEGFDLSQVSDPLFYLNTNEQSYSELTQESLTYFLNSKI